MNPKEQGVKSEKVFHGEGSSEAARLVYEESAPLFADILRKNLNPGGGYKLVDLGSSKGEFLKDLLDSLPEYKFKTLATDINPDDLKRNTADLKFISHLSKSPLKDKSVDVTIARYALAWNTLEQQKEILKEIVRTTKKIAIIQHQGSEDKHPEGLQNASQKLFNGIVPVLKRDTFFFSSPTQLEEYLNELNVNFEKLQNRKVDGLSDIFIEKYNLSPEDSKTVKDILKNSDYVQQVTWVLKF